MSKVKVTYIVSEISKALEFEWVADYLNKDRFELSFILLNPGSSYLEDYLKKKGIPVKTVRYRGKKDYVSALFKTYALLRNHRPDIIHVHLFPAGRVGLVAGKFAGIYRRIYTRHYSTYHHRYFPHAIKYDKLINRLSTDIVAISDVVKQVLKQEGVDEKKICKIPHGFDLNMFHNPDPGIIQQLEEKYKTADRFPVIGVISRYTEWKGIQYIIPAFKKLLDTYPKAKLILANAKGDYAGSIKALLRGLPPDSYGEIDFECNLAELYQLLDIFVHVPIDSHSEAFGQIYVEALASGIPSIFTMSGIAHEFIKDRENALVVPYKDSEAIYNAMGEILNNERLMDKLIIAGKASIEQFSINRMIEGLEKLYLV
ncbi:MAG: glycosyltransferase family 4 protein [Deltaproteobacteria bacterium]|nr:glycosyltransferase family 4 protein [Deltaproteobacteria bacterium]